jgi:hypothetical protein
MRKSPSLPDQVPASQKDVWIIPDAYRYIITVASPTIDPAAICGQEMEASAKICSLRRAREITGHSGKTVAQGGQTS